MSLGVRVKELRESLGLTQTDLAEKIGVDPSYISQIEGDHRKPSLPIRGQLAAELRTTIADLNAADGYPTTAPPPEQRTSTDIVRELQQTLEREKRGGPIAVTVVSSHAPAGQGSYSDPETTSYFPRDYERGHQFIAVPISGDCLEPEVMDGHIAIVDKDASPQFGDIVIVEHDGETLAKILEQHNGVRWLVALQHREPIRVDESTLIVGKVVWAGYPVR